MSQNVIGRDSAKRFPSPAIISSNDNQPWEIGKNILSRISSGKSLARLKRICESWRSLLSSPNFANMHLESQSSCSIEFHDQDCYLNKKVAFNISKEMFELLTLPDEDYVRFEFTSIGDFVRVSWTKQFLINLDGFESNKLMPK